MRILNCEQGTAEWFHARLGIPTASEFHRIITPKTLKPSGGATSDRYLHELIAEWALGEPLDSYVSDYMERGKLLEPQAFSYYAFERDLEPQKVGFVVRADGWAGCSPDALVGEDGGAEIKCPAPPQHVANLLGNMEAHRIQVQGSMWICQRDWWDTVSFHPDLPGTIIRVERDEEAIKAISTAVGAFVTRLHDAQCRMIEAGYVDEELRRTMPGVVPA